MVHRSRRGIWVIAVGLILWVTSMGTASAHTEVQRAEPGPAQAVDAPLDRVSLRFLDPVQVGVEIDVADEAGRSVPGLGPARQSADRRDVTIDFDEISQPGRYVVSYEFVAEDGASQRDSYQFSVVAADDRSAPSGVPVAALGLGGVIVTATTVALRRRRSGS